MHTLELFIVLPQLKITLTDTVVGIPELQG